mmetsp:Transcript_53807/g.107920  ORF Transcript_53807/g.107920 Transcript_53807/m.107920 type:complete len:219 (+) Transcript_53807:684-1340(+)
MKAGGLGVDLVNVSDRDQRFVVERKLAPARNDQWVIVVASVAFALEISRQILEPLQILPVACHDARPDRVVVLLVALHHVSRAVQDVEPDDAGERRHEENQKHHPERTVDGHVGAHDDREEEDSDGDDKDIEDDDDHEEVLLPVDDGQADGEKEGRRQQLEQACLPPAHIPLEKGHDKPPKEGAQRACSQPGHGVEAAVHGADGRDEHGQQTRNGRLP